MKRFSIMLLCTAILVMFLGLDCAKYPNGPDKANDATQLQGNGKGGPGGGGGHDGETDTSSDDGDEDSDRPPWAGDPSVNPHIGKNPNSGVTKGGMYGDLYILYRNNNGEPHLDAEGRVLVIAFVSNGYDDEGHPILSYDSEGFPIQYAEEGEEGFTLEYNEEDEIIATDEAAPAEVEFGRLNLIRSPPHVLSSALDEALSAMTASNVLTITRDFGGRLLTVYEEVDENGDNLMKTIDSPRENLAIYKELMLNDFSGELGFLLTYFEQGDLLEIAASAFGAGSVKTGFLTVDEIVYCNTFLGVNSTSGPGIVDSYYDFTGSAYNRSCFDDRYIRMTLVNGEYDENRTPITINEAASAGHFGYTGKWNEDNQGGNWYDIAAFRTAADDAVQVIDFVHGDSNIEYLWDYEPEI